MMLPNPCRTCWLADPLSVPGKYLDTSSLGGSPASRKQLPGAPGRSLGQRAFPAGVGVSQDKRPGTRWVTPMDLLGEDPPKGVLGAKAFVRGRADDDGNATIGLEPTKQWERRTKHGCEFEPSLTQVRRRTARRGGPRHALLPSSVDQANSCHEIVIRGPSCPAFTLSVRALAVGAIVGMVSAIYIYRMFCRRSSTGRTN